MAQHHQALEGSVSGPLFEINLLVLQVPHSCALGRPPSAFSGASSMPGEHQKKEWATASDSSDSEHRLIDSQTGRYHVEDAWSESLDVQRGAAPMRLDLKHGFHKHIVRP